MANFDDLKKLDQAKKALQEIPRATEEDYG